MISLPVIYEDDDIVVINKPAGVMVHPDGVSEDETVSDWMAHTYPASSDVGESMVLKNGVEIARPGVVHRLDRDTSGVLILAKTDEMHAFLKEQFQNRNIRKTYLAIANGIVKEAEGVIDVPIGRSAQNFKLWSAQRGARGQLRDAQTKYERIAHNEHFSVLRLFPKTGRTHQLRVHLKYLHHPIVCDTLYAPKLPCALGLKRMALHAQILSLNLPSGEEKSFEAPLPEDLKTALKTFEDLPF